MSWGAHSSLGNQFPINGYVQWSGQSSWWLIETVESYNGQRYVAGQSSYMLWFSSNAFGGTNYSNTPIGAVSSEDEPFVLGVSNPQTYFGLWAAGKNLAICSWNPTINSQLLVIGDPFVTK